MPFRGAFVLLAGVVREAARGLPDAELQRRGRDVPGFVLVRAPEREARFEALARAMETHEPLIRARDRPGLLVPNP